MTLETLNSEYPWPDTVPSVPTDMHCWFSKHHLRVFGALLGGCPSDKTTYLEIGTWTGGGSTAWVLAHTDMHVICVDTWEGGKEHHKKEEYRRRLPSLYDTFCRNLWNERDRLTPVRENSRDGLVVVKEHGISPDFIYIDGSHEEDDVYLDISDCLRLFPEAIILGDDFVNGSGQLTSIATAIDRCHKDKLFPREELARIGRCWWLTRNLEW
tara:strand:- start:3304 stop:3939 length:636 start_codon:yes stop_codon:yes gene_type:complete